MKKIKIIIIALIINAVLCGMLAAQTRIAVLPFTPDEKISKSAMSYLTEIFTVEMVNSRKFTVVERARLDAALKEMQMQSGDMFDESSAVELGKMAGAEMVFFGSIFRFGGKALLSIKGMDIQTATLKYAKQEKGGSDSKLEKAVKMIAEQIIKETVGASDEAEGSMDTMERLRNKKEDKSVNYNSAETKVLDKYIYGKWGISPDSYEDMKHYYRKNIGGGVALAAIGGTFGLSGIMCFGLFPVIYEGSFIAGPILLAVGGIITPLCSIPFVFAYRIKSIYRKTTGQKLAFFDRTSIGGGYDWKNKEVTVAMAIRL